MSQAEYQAGFKLMSSVVVRFKAPYINVCVFICVCVLTQRSWLQSSIPSCDLVSPFLINSTLSSLPPCQCSVSAPPLSLIANSRTCTPALCHTATVCSSHTLVFGSYNYWLLPNPVINHIHNNFTAHCSCLQM